MGILQWKMNFDIVGGFISLQLIIRVITAVYGY
jgi:hypothetical protein